MMKSFETQRLTWTAIRFTADFVSTPETECKRDTVCCSSAGKGVARLCCLRRPSRRNAKEDAERYHREQYPKISEMLSHLLDADPGSRKTIAIDDHDTDEVSRGVLLGPKGR